MRKWLIAIVVIVLLLGVMPYGAGLIAEKRVTRLIAQLPPSPGLKITLTDYQRGWLQSRAHIQIQMPTAISIAATATQPEHFLPISVNGTAIINHGVLSFAKNEQGKREMHFALATIQSTLEVDEPTRRAVAEYIVGDLPTLRAFSILSFKNTLHTTQYLPAFALKSKEAGKLAVDIQGLNSESTIENNPTRLSGYFTVNNLRIVSTNKQIKINAININYNQQQQKIANQAVPLWTGAVDYQLPSLIVLQDEKPFVELQNLKMRILSQMNNEKYGVNTEIFVNKIIANNTTYGPANYQFSVKNLDANILANLKQQMTVVGASQISAQQRQALLFGLLPMWMNLLEKGASVELQTFDLATPDGQVNAKGNIGLQQVDNSQPNNNTQVSNNKPGTGAPLPVATMLSKLDANFELRIPIALMKKQVQLFYSKFYYQQLEAQKATMMVAQQQQGASTSQTASTVTVTAGTPQTDEEITNVADQKTQEMLRRWVNSGSLIENNGNYQLTLNYKNGQLLINGNPLSSALTSTLVGQGSDNTTNTTNTTAAAVPIPQPSANTATAAPAKPQTAPTAPTVTQQPTSAIPAMPNTNNSQNNPTQNNSTNNPQQPSTNATQVQQTNNSDISIQ